MLTQNKKKKKNACSDYLHSIVPQVKGSVKEQRDDNFGADSKDSPC